MKAGLAWTADLLTPVQAGQYPQGAAAILLALNSVTTDADTGACTGIMDLLAVLSASDVRRAVVHAAVAQQASETGRADRPAARAAETAETAETAYRALARLAGASLLTFSVDGSAVAAHRLVTRVIPRGASPPAATPPSAAPPHGYSTPRPPRWNPAGTSTGPPSAT